MTSSPKFAHPHGPRLYSPRLSDFLHPPWQHKELLDRHDWRPAAARSTSSIRAGERGLPRPDPGGHLRARRPPSLRDRALAAVGHLAADPPRGAAAAGRRGRDRAEARRRHLRRRSSSRSSKAAWRCSRASTAWPSGAGLQTGMGRVSRLSSARPAPGAAGLGLDAPADVTAVTRTDRCRRGAGSLPDRRGSAGYPAPRRPGTGLNAGNGSFHGSVLDLFLHRGHPALAYSRTDLIAEAADPELARALQIQRGAPLLKLEAQLYAQDGRVVDYSISYFVPGYFRFHVVRRIGERAPAPTFTQEERGNDA